MPTYQYQAKNAPKGCPTCKNGFEELQRMKDQALTKCPSCQAPVQRVISAANVNTKVQSNKSLLSDKNLKKHGFTKLVKEAKGKYRKVT